MAEVSAALLAELSAGSSPGAWTLDPARSSVALRSKTMWGLLKVRGAFTGISGGGAVAADGTVTGRVAVAVASLSTKNKQRDAHLQSADLFDSARYPELVFELTGAAPSGDQIMLTGVLTVRDQSRTVSFPATVAATPAGSATTVKVDAVVQVNRGDYGMTWNRMGMASMDNTVTVEMVWTRS